VPAGVALAEPHRLATAVDARGSAGLIHQLLLDPPLPVLCRHSFEDPVAPKWGASESSGECEVVRLESFELVHALDVALDQVDLPAVAHRYVAESDPAVDALRDKLTGAFVAVVVAADLRRPGRGACGGAAHGCSFPVGSVLHGKCEAVTPARLEPEP
jgi:hypothetical protein